MTEMINAKYQNYKTYLTEDHLLNVKESFKILLNLVKNKTEGLSYPRVLDVGCATGALIHYLSQNLSGDYVGLDISSALLSKAIAKMPEYCWVEGTAVSLPEEFENAFDLSFCLGTLGVFDEAEAQKAVNELIKCTKKGGRIFILAQFNDNDVDVLVTHRKYQMDILGSWEKGWNIYSKRTVLNWVQDQASNVQFHDFAIPFDLRKQDDPVRTWTINTEEDHKQLINGLNLLVNLKFLEITI